MYHDVQRYTAILLFMVPVNHVVVTVNCCKGPHLEHSNRLHLKCKNIHSVKSLRDRAKPLHSVKIFIPHAMSCCGYTVFDPFFSPVFL